MISIVRVEHNKDCPFLVVAKETVRDKALSFEARGFLVFLLAKPDDWTIRADVLAEECGLHRVTVYRLLKKLIEKGYVRRDVLTRRKPDGRFDSAALYTVFETRETAELYGEKIPF
jgi:hypothetical protein